MRWYQLANATPSFIWVSRQDGWLSYANDQWCKHTGLTQEESCGYGWRNAIHPDDLERIAHVWDTPNEDGSFDAVELRYQTTSGAYRWLLARAYPIRDQDGNITEVYGVSTDIQDLKEAQATLKESEEHWRHLVNTVPVAVWTNDSQARLTYSNDRMFTYTGLTEEEFADPDWPRGIFHPDDYEPVWGSWLKAVAEGTPYEVELRYREKGGQKYRWAMTRAIPVRDENGAVQAWYGTTTDIDDLKQTQQALEESRSQWEQLANSIPALVWTASPDGRLTFQNKKWEEEFALPVEKALGFGWLDVLHPDDRERARKAWENTYKHGAPYQNEVRYLNKHGEYRWLFARATPVLDSEGRVVVWYGTCMDVHDLKVAQDTITESEERFRTMAESSPLMIWMSDETAALTYTNQHWRQFTGRDFDEMDAGRRFEGWDKLVHPDDIDRVLQRHKDAVLAHQPFEQEFRLLRYDGEYRWVIASGGPRFTNEGKFLGFTGSFIDITERKEVQHLLEESKENWRQLTNSIPAIVWLSDPQGNRTYFNDQLYKETGITSEEGLGDGWLKIVHPDDRERGLLFWQNAIRKEMPYEIELRYRNKDGDYRWHYSRGLPIRNSHGKVTAWCGTTLDIHDLKEAQHAVAESEERFRTMANAIPAAIWIARAEDAYVIYHNDQWQTMTGQPQEEALGYSWGSIIHPEDWERTLAAWSHAAQNETIYEVENRYLSASGEYRWVITRAVPVRDAQGNLLLYATSLDIDDLKKAQQAVIESEERFRMMAEAARFMITTINPAAEPIYMNKAWFEFTGYSMEEVAKAGWMKLLVHPNDWVRIESLIQEKFALREPFDMELRMRRYDGQYRWIYTLAAPRFSSSGEFVGYISSNLDITERKEAEEALQDYATRLERSNKELEHFAVIASHDLQAPLRKVQFFSDVLKESAAGQLNMESLDYLERMQRAAGRMQNLIDDLLDLSRVIRRGKPFEEMSLSDMMPGVLDEVYEQMKASHGRVEVGNMIDMVGDSSQIRQLLQNLIENGLKFHRPDVPPIVKVNSRILNSHELEITVEDNGIGFKEEYSEQIFETFRRLHSENAYPGTGIGLSLVKKIVERHGGRIEVQSEEGVGSLFRIILPILPSGKYKAE